MKLLSPIQEEILMDCHERKLQHQDPRSTRFTRHCADLLYYKLIEFVTVKRENKELSGFYITEEGVGYLNNMTTQE